MRILLRAGGWPGWLVLGLLAVCSGITPVGGATNPGAPGSHAPSSSPASGLIDNIFQDPKQYMDREVTVEGTLMAEGLGFAVTFFLRHDSGARMEVNTWAPLEVPPPPPGKGRPPVKLMADYVGQRLRLTGRLQDQRGRIILQVSSVSELP